MSKVGFTGTREGMTDAQRDKVRELLRGALEVHHGDCVGADDEFHAIARDLGLRVVIHPPEKQAYRAWNTGDVHAREKDYLARNRDIAHACDYLVAAPKSMDDQSGGTWYTIRYAISKRRSVVLVRPDGSSLWEHVSGASAASTSTTIGAETHQDTEGG